MKESCYVWLLAGPLWKYLPDAVAIRLKYKRIMGIPLRLRHPVTFNEKLQWFKLHDRDPLHTQMADKYGARAFVAEKIGAQYLVPLLAVYDSCEGIDSETLPDRFVMKCTHDFGSAEICRGKSTFDFGAAVKRLSACLKQNHYLYGREWPYKNILPRVIVEDCLADDAARDELTDYKFFCFGGRSDIVMVCTDRLSGSPCFFFFDRDWNSLDFCSRWKYDPTDSRLQRPPQMEEMLGIAQRLLEGTRFLSVDLYVSCGRVYFGEMTFYPCSGLDRELSPEADALLGGMLSLR